MNEAMTGIRPAPWRAATALLACLAVGLLAIAGATAPEAEAANTEGFAKRDAPINAGRLYDLGVSDYDRDGRFELFSLNHKFLGTFIEGEPGSWTDLLGSTGLSPSPQFPGFEDLLHPPAIDAPGLYIYAESRTAGDDDIPLVHIVANDVEGLPLLAEEAEGTVSLPSPKVRVARRDGADVTVERDGDRTIVSFRVAEQGHITLKVRKVDLPPIEFEIDQAPLLAQTFVGARKVRALTPTFTLRLIDRHGAAFLDADRDGNTDVWLVRGGLGGGITKVPGKLEDELLINDGLGNFGDEIAGSGLQKGTCRSRRASAIDYDGDGVLDLFSSCKGATPKLYRGTGPGSYRGVSRTLRRAAERGSYYRWLDVAGDLRPELLITFKGRIEVLQATRSGGWRRIQRTPTRNRNALVHALVGADFDRDGDTDAWIGAPSGNTLLLNRGGRLVARDPALLGLPRRGSGAAWVDVQNDGRLDLHSLPRGIYAQQRDGSFERTGILSGVLRSIWAITSWWDYDGDGDRDAATAIRKPGGLAAVKTRLWENLRSGNHWLQLDVRGSGGNREAVGAKVKIKAGGKQQVSRVGEADGSRFSQGHYRVYFGLGAAEVVDLVKVRWPGGGIVKRFDVPADQLLAIGPP